MGQTINILLLCLPWLFYFSPVSPLSVEKLSQLDSGIADDQRPIQLRSDDSSIPLKDHELSQIQRSFEGLTRLKRTTTSTNTSKPTLINEIIKAFNYLKSYNYISPIPKGNQDVRTALETFQRFMHLPVTGMLDNTTLAEMKKKRCGVPDVEINDSSLGRRKKRFAVSKKKWDKTALHYAFETYTTDMSVQTQKAVIARAFKMWSDVSPLVFTLTNDLSKANIKIMFGTLKHGQCTTPFDGRGNVLAHAFYPKSGQLHFDDDEYFTDGTHIGTNLLAVAIHEIGHTMGLAHSTDINSIMYPVAHQYVPNLTLGKDDKNAIRYLYAGGTNSPGSAVCQDMYLSCASITTYCKEYPSFMISKCRKTCKFCV